MRARFPAIVGLNLPRVFATASADLDIFRFSHHWLAFISPVAIALFNKSIVVCMI
jgi:hypothetical protein